MTDVLTLALFDEQISEVRVDDRDALTTIVQRNRRYLGTVEVPFYTLYSQGGVHGELRLHCPPVLLGYRPPGIVHVGPSGINTPGGATRTMATQISSGGMAAAPAEAPAAAGGWGPPAGSGGGGAAGGGGASWGAAPGAGTGMLPPTGAPLGGMAAAPVGGTAAAAPVVSSSTNVLDRATLNSRSPHVFVHISVAPALPMQLEEEQEAPLDAFGGARATTTAAGKLRQLVLASTRGEGKREVRRVMEAALAWMARYSGLNDEDGKPRIVMPIVQTIDGEVALVTRYLGRQLPPPDPAAAVTAASTAARGAAAGGGGGGSDGSSSVSNMPPATPARTLGSLTTPARGVTFASPAGSDTPARGAGGGAGGGAANLEGGEVVSQLVPRLSTVEALTRFVSLVPFLPDSQMFEVADTTLDIWATTPQTLDMGAGDGEEHAIMLNNYLMWLDTAGSEGGGLGGARPTVGSLGSTLPAGGMRASSTALAGPSPGGVGSGSGWRTFIVVGRGQPEGQTVYVVRQLKSHAATTTLLIDASTGTAYHADDDTCALRSVGMVASPTNCWANIQPYAQPWRMSWDLEDARCWAPLFTTAHPHPGPDVLPPLQSAPVYRLPDVRLAWTLEAEIHTALSAQLRAWRPRYVTRIRGDMTTHLRGLLLELEARASGRDTASTVLSSEGPVTVGGGAAAAAATASRAAFGAMSGGVRDLTAEHVASLERLVSRFRVQGFPLHAPFSEMDALVRLVRSTSVHRIEEEGVQYALAVAVLPHVNALFSVWVYVVVLQPFANLQHTA